MEIREITFSFFVILAIGYQAIANCNLCILNVMPIYVYI